MRRLTAALITSALITPAVVMVPTVDLHRLAGGRSASPQPVDPVITTLALKPTGPAKSSKTGSKAGSAPGVTSALRSAAAPAVLSAAVRTKDFQTLAVTWDLPRSVLPRLAVTARVHGDDGWGSWFGLEVDDVNATADEVRSSAGGSVAATAKRYRGGTEPYWAGDSDGVQVRVDVLAGTLPTGLKVELIDPGSSDYDALVGVQPPGSAVSAPSRPTIYPRSAWGADESKVRDAPTVMPAIKAAVIHHTAGENGYSRAAVPRILRATYAYHLSRGWDDIGYNFLVDRFGRIWEGRAGGVEKAIQGAHAGGFNYQTFGVSIMGNYDGGTKPSAATLDAVARLIAWKLDLFRVDPLGKTRLTSSGGGTARYKAGRTVTLPTIMGHRDVGYTACPGKNVYAKLGSIRAAVVRYTQAQLIGVQQSSSSVGYGGAGPTVRFAPLTTQSWQLQVAEACLNRDAGGTRGSVKRGQSVRTAWNGKVSGQVAKAGIYRATVTSSSKSGSARPFTGVFSVRPPANPPVRTGPAGPAGPGAFRAVQPLRLYNSQYGASQPLGPGGRVDLKVTGRGGVPATGVTHVVLNVSAPCSSQTSAFRVRPAGQPLTGISALTFHSGERRTTEVTVPVGADGYVSIRNASGVAHLRVDLVGYYAQGSGAGFRAVPQRPAYDSRSAGAGKPFGPNARRTVTVPRIDGVTPSSVKAVLVAFSVFAPTGGGEVSAYAYGGPVTTGTTLVYGRQVPAAGTAVVPVRDGKFSLRNRGATAHLQAVVVGVYTTAAHARYDELVPRLIWGTAKGSLVDSAARTFRVAGGSTGVPADATAVTLWVRASGAKAPSSLSVWAGGSARPATYPVVRLGKAAAVTTQVVIPVSADGLARLRAAVGAARVNVTVVGYYR